MSTALPTQPTQSRQSTPSRHTAALAALVALLLAVVLSGCIQPGRTAHPHSDPVEGAVCPVAPDPSITTHARIAWQGIANGDLVVKDLGLLEACMPNARIEWARFNGGNDVIQAFGSTSIDIGIYGSSAGVKAMSPPLDLPISLVWVPDVIGTSEALVAFDPAIKRVEDLRGRTVAVTFGATPHYALLSMLDLAGIRDQVEVINLTNDKMVAAARAGQIDAAWTWEPTLTQLEENGGHVVVDSAQAAQQGVVTFDMHTARDEFIAAEPEFMLMWTRAQDAAARRIHDDPDAAAESIAAQLGVPTATAREQMHGYTYPTAKDLAGTEWFGGEKPEEIGAAEQITSTARFLAQVRMTSGAHPVQEYATRVHSEAVKEVAK